MDYELLTNLGLIGAFIGLMLSARMRYHHPVHLTDRSDRRHEEICSDGQAPDALREDGHRIPGL